MMPLTLAGAGNSGTVKKVGGKAETRQFLETLGFVQGCPVTVVADIGGNVIVKVKESRVAVSREMARHIMV
ncbi:MAG: ferrous iron transport protein A [Clostridiales Family XIII bacterium]|jgi:ferrous iron transport protein A|nr:ferrous iron transport protein A [Clostridiales Family XIII bacterium]